MRAAMSPEPNLHAWIEAALAGLAERIDARPELRAEFAASRAVFFDGRAEPVAELDRQLALRRHLEWFALERPSDALEGVPAECLLAEWQAALDETDPELVQAVLRSNCGIFEVLELAPDGRLLAADLVGQTRVLLEEPELAREITVGDLLVGRVFPLDEQRGCMSPAGLWLRHAQLVEALRHDLASARGGRRGKLRISQAEVERMFHGPAPLVAPGVVPARGAEQARERALELLRGAGFHSAEAEQALSELALGERAVDPLHPGAGDRLGDLLSRLAFDSQVDLDAARALLLAAAVPAPGPAISAESSEPEPPLVDQDGPGASEEEIREALAEYDRMRDRGRDLEAAFRALERRLGLEPGDDEFEGEPSEAVPEELEDVPPIAALVQEYAWEREAGGAPLSYEAAAQLAALAGEAAELSGLEDLDAARVAAFACSTALERGFARDEAGAERLVDTLLQFAQWCERTQDHPLEQPSRAALAQLLPELKRVAPLWTAASAPAAVAEVVEVLPGAARVRLRGGALSQLELGAEIRALRSGDWVALAGAKAPLRLRGVYPAAAGAVLQARFA